MADAASSTTPQQQVPANANEGCVGPAAQEAGKAAACAGCPNKAACASGKGREVDPGERPACEAVSIPAAVDAVF